MGWPRGALVVLFCCAALVGCDGSGTDRPEPEVHHSRVGECYNEASTRPVPCAEPHLAQTVYVSDQQPPPDRAAALAPCRTAQAAFLGQDFNTRVDVEVWVPADASWYRCDIVVRNSTGGSGGYLALSGSLRGVMRKGAPIDLQACLRERFDPARDQKYVSCRRPHVAHELIVAPAIGTLDEPYPGDLARRAVLACNSMAAASDYLGPGRRVDAFFPKNADAWATGERSATCWVTATRGTLPPVTASPNR